MKHLLKMYSLSGHPKCRWVCFFIRTDLENCSITSLAHQWIPCSEWVPSEWDKTITTIYNMTPIHQLMSSEMQSCVFVIGKSIINMFLTSNHCFKYESSIHNIAFSSEKVIWSESGEKYAQINKWEQSKTVVKKCWWILMWDDRG